MSRTLRLLLILFLILILIPNLTLTLAPQSKITIKNKIKSRHLSSFFQTA